jgi:GTPase SAR1 family protein
LLVYSIADRSSFLHIGDWLRDIRQHAEEGVSIIMVGNMRDLCEGEEDDDSGGQTKGQREVTTAEAEAYAKSEG